MKALILTAANSLSVGNIPEPSNLLPGEVLVQMQFSPVNPSDLAFLSGNYGIQKPYPCVPGFEGSGLVVASGGGLYANYLKGKRVACVASNKYDGTWAQFMKTTASQCVVLGKNVSYEQGSMCFVNPLTALDFLDIVKKDRFKALVLTAAASALGKMVAHLAKSQGIPIAGLVRKNENLAVLHENGFDLALNTETDGWQESLQSWAKPFGKTLLPDCIGGGSIPSRVLACLPAHSRLLTYGSLDYAKPQTIVARDFIFNEYEIKGYWLSRNITRNGLLKSYLQTRQVQKILGGGFQNKIQSTNNLDNYAKVLTEAQTAASMGKSLFKLAT
jgi:NADPH:quinone reductase